MNIIKDAAIENIKRLPDNCTIEDIMCEINFIARVYEGLNDLKNNNGIGTNELFNRLHSLGE